METAIRFSTGSDRRFLIADVVSNSLQLCQTTSISDCTIQHRVVADQQRLPSFSAFDWNQAQQNLVAIGTDTSIRIIDLDTQDQLSSTVTSWSHKQARRCNTVAWNADGQVAAGMERSRTEPGLAIYDRASLLPADKPVVGFAIGETITSIKFGPNDANIVLSGSPAKGLRVFDRRNPSADPPTLSTRACHLLSIDPLDENYYVSAGPPGDNVVALWDRRVFGRAKPSASSNTFNAEPLLEISPAALGAGARIWSLRFSGYKRGTFAVLSDTGRLRLFDADKHDASARNPIHDAASSFEGQHDVWFMRTTTNLTLNRPNIKEADQALSIMAFDHAPPGMLAPGHAVLSMRSDKTFEIIPLPRAPVKIALNGDNTMGFPDFDAVAHPPHKGTIAEDLLELESKVIRALSEANATDELANMSLKDDKQAKRRSKDKGKLNSRTNIAPMAAPLSSRERHEQFLTYGFPRAKFGLGAMLLLEDVQRRRCLEGYLFNCDRNKEIVRNDPWLVAMWETIGLLHDMADQDGMLADDVDLSYLGVNDLWQARLATNRRRAQTTQPVSSDQFDTIVQHIAQKKRLPSWDGIKTSRPSTRQLCLLVCGFIFNTSRLKSKCMEIFDRGEHYKAMMVAFCHGRRDIAIELVKVASRNGIIEGTALAAVIASESMSREMRGLCEFMAEDAKDLYLKALLVHFVTGDWSPVVSMDQLPVLYRVAIALRYLPDPDLDDFLQTATTEAVEYGHVEGIVLTGLYEKAMDLFQNWITKSNDLQTAVLATAFVNPKYMEDARFDIWKESYFWQLQAWRCFIKRTAFTAQHNRMAVTRDGVKLIKPPPAQIALRCNHCHASIARHDPEQSANPSNAGPAQSQNARTSKQTPAMNAGTRCPKCNRPMPRCAVCMQWLGSPDPATIGGATALAAEEDPLAKHTYFCLRCGHGYHAHHAKGWFAKHQICPVPDCQCTCAARSGAAHIE